MAFGVPRRILAFVVALGVLGFSTVCAGTDFMRTFPLPAATIARIVELNNLSLGASILLSPLVSLLLERRRLLTIWSIAALSVTGAPLIFGSLNANEGAVSCFAVVFGVLTGFGVPSLLSLLADMTRVEERGRVGGTILLLSLPATIIVKLFSSLGLLVGVVGLMLFQRLLTAFLLLYGLKSGSSLHRRENPPTSLRSVRQFVFWVMTWIGYCAVFTFTIPTKRSIFDLFPSNTLDLMTLTENIVISVFAPIGGVILDRVGRRKVAWIAFCFLGLGYACLGINPVNLVAWTFYVIVDGMAWSLFFMVFIFIIWADISQPNRPELFFALGCPYLFLFYPLSFAVDFPTYFEPRTMFFAAFILMFLSTIPLAFTMETLPRRFAEYRTIRAGFRNILKNPHRRKRLSVYADILMAVRRRGEGAMFTHVMYEANLSSVRLRQRLSELKSLKLIEDMPDGRLLLTEEGEKFLKKLESLRDQ